MVETDLPSLVSGPECFGPAASTAAAAAAADAATEDVSRHAKLMHL